jgi:hypothetical protein
MKMRKLHALAALSALTVMVGTIPVLAASPTDPQFNSREAQAQEEQQSRTTSCGEVLASPQSYPASEVAACQTENRY